MLHYSSKTRQVILIALWRSNVKWVRDERGRGETNGKAAAQKNLNEAFKAAKITEN